MKEFTPPAQAEEEADEEVLWNMPQDEDALGTFDEKGNFTIGGPERANAFSMEDFRLSSSVPGHDRLPPPSSKTPLVSADTKWYYRDPSGQIQGPFPTKKMLHWYSRKYFPETLPLRRAQDILFEPMSEWKSKCGGVCPFEIAEIVDESPTSTFTSPALSPRSGESITACPNDPAMFVNKQEATAPVVNAFAKLGLSWTGQGQAPDTTEGANHGLAEDQLCFLQQFKAKSSGSGGGWKKVEGVSAIPIDIAPSSAPRPTAVPTPKPLVSPLELVPAASPTVGWSKPVANSRPLSEIMAEEAQMELSRRASQPKGGAPKSFAETLCLNGGGVEVARPPPPPRQVIVKSPTATTAAMAMATTTAVAPPKPFSSSKPTTATEKSPLESNPTADIKNWCIGRLRAVEGTYDVNICTICLMDQKTPADVLGFVEANMATNKMDMKAFANEFIERRFGMMAGRASVGEGKKPVMAEEEFITVGRKQHRKK